MKLLIVEFRLFIAEWLLSLALKIVPRNTLEAQALTESVLQYLDLTDRGL